MLSDALFHKGKEVFVLCNIEPVRDLAFETQIDHDDLFDELVLKACRTSVQTHLPLVFTLVACYVVSKDGVVRCEVSVPLRLAFDLEARLKSYLLHVFKAFEHDQFRLRKTIMCETRSFIVKSG